MAKHEGKRKDWVKDDIKVVLQQWESKSRHELADMIGCSSNQVTYIATQARKLGYKIPKKHKVGVVQSLLREVIDELKQRG